MSGGTGFCVCQHSDLWRHTAQDFEKAGQLRDREMELKAQISAITGAAKETTDAETETSAEGSGPLVTDADIAHIVAQWTGIPVEKVRWAARLMCRLHLIPLLGQPKQRRSSCSMHCCIPCAASSGACLDMVTQNWRRFICNSCVGHLLLLVPFQGPCANKLQPLPWLRGA